MYHATYMTNYVVCYYPIYQTGKERKVLNSVSKTWLVYFRLISILLDL
jgi:hypothetical protein